MPIDPRRVKALFHSALDLPDPASRAAFLDREGGDDVELRARLDEILAAFDRPTSALDRPLAAEDATSADVARFRLFAGLSIDEAAEALGLSRATAFREWAYARSWLTAALSRKDFESPQGATGR